MSLSCFANMNIDETGRIEPKMKQLKTEANLNQNIINNPQFKLTNEEQLKLVCPLFEDEVNFKNNFSRK